MIDKLIHPSTIDFAADPTLKEVLRIYTNKRPDVISGFSSKVFGNMSFNYSPHDVVLENRQKFLLALGINLEDVVAMKPIHGVNIQTVNADNKGNGAFDFQSGIPDTDGLVTEDRSVALALNPADCVPILFVHKDSSNPVKAIAHAGKAGTDLGITNLMVNFLKGDFGIKPDELLVGIGPAILCHPINLSLINKNQLISAGVKEENIDLSGICTYCSALQDKLFSDEEIQENHEHNARFMTVIK